MDSKHSITLRKTNHFLGFQIRKLQTYFAHFFFFLLQACFKMHAHHKARFLQDNRLFIEGHHFEQVKRSRHLEFMMLNKNTEDREIKKKISLTNKRMQATRFFLER